ncbi:hypothetical protein OPT61_g810 [Boeremia exigua]|uniref:Uncharacterized protein n=1 Tax=Boeremia exigua TaxID=749465 RepID=A0ACC2ISF5_9PLEO|nr:hypothetical protein OPT61_g810 [Boeremia exigua]
MYTGAILARSGYRINNANPRASLSPSAVQGKVHDAVFQKYQRAEAAMNNSFEQLPLYAVAVLASIFAERVTIGGATGLDSTGLTTFVGAFLAVRIAYTVAYISTADYKKSFIRSVLWAVGGGLSIWQIYKAALLLG